MPYSQRQVLKDPVKERIASALYYNRYGAAKTTRNNNQIHFVPTNLEIKTAVEPKNRYNRTINATKNISGSVNRQASNQVAFKPRKSGSSDSSAYSYLSMPSWRANLSSLYWRFQLIFHSYFLYYIDGNVWKIHRWRKSPHPEGEENRELPHR